GVQDSQPATGAGPDIEQSPPFFKTGSGGVHHLGHLGQHLGHGQSHRLVLFVYVGHQFQGVHVLQAIVVGCLFGDHRVFIFLDYNNCRSIFLNASSLKSQGSNSVTRTSMSSTPQILYRCRDPIFSEIQGATTFLEHWIMAFFIWTISQSNSIRPSVGCMALVPRKQMSTLISERVFMALPPMAICDPWDNLPPIKMTSILLFPSSCPAMGKLGVKQVNLIFWGNLRANSNMVVPPPKSNTWPSWISPRAFSAIKDFFSREYTFSVVGPWLLNPNEMAPPCTFFK